MSKKALLPKFLALKKYYLQLLKLTIRHYQIISILRALCGAATKVYRAVTK